VNIPTFTKVSSSTIQTCRDTLSYTISILYPHGKYFHYVNLKIMIGIVKIDP